MKLMAWLKECQCPSKYEFNSIIHLACTFISFSIVYLDSLITKLSLLILGPDKASAHHQHEPIWDVLAKTFTLCLCFLSLLSHLFFGLAAHGLNHVHLHAFSREILNLSVLLLLELFLHIQFLALNLSIDLLCQFCQLSLVLDHFFRFQDSLLLIIDDVSDRNAAQQIEQQEVDEPREHHHLKGAVWLREQTEHSLHWWVRLLALLDEGANILQDENLINAEHDAKAHGHPNAWLLLDWGEDALRESEQHVKDNCETQAPIDLNVGVIWQLYGQVVPSVLVAAALSLEALLGLDDFLVATLEFWVLTWVICLFGLLVGNIDLMVWHVWALQTKELVKVLFFVCGKKVIALVTDTNSRRERTYLWCNRIAGMQTEQRKLRRRCSLWQACSLLLAQERIVLWQAGIVANSQ